MTTDPVTTASKTHADLVLAYFVAGDVPKEIRLSECVTPGVPHLPGYIQGFHGLSAGTGLAHANHVARQEGKIAKAVVVTVELATSIERLTRSPPLAEIADTEFLHCTRMSAEITNKMSDFWYSEMQAHGWPEAALQSVKWGRPEQFIPLFPSAMEKWLKEPVMASIKLFVYPTKITGPSPARGILHVGALKREDISSAKMRYYNDVVVHLDR